MNGTVEQVTDTTVTISGKTYNYVTPYTTSSGKYMSFGAKGMVGSAPNYRINVGDYVEYSAAEMNGVHFLKFIKKDTQGNNTQTSTQATSNGATRDDSIRLQHCEKVVAGFLTEHPDIEDAEVEKFVNRVSVYGHMLFEKR